MFSGSIESDQWHEWVKGNYILNARPYSCNLVSSIKEIETQIKKWPEK